MADDDKKNPSFDGPPEGSAGLDEPTGEIEEDATRQITGDALEQIRESASNEMAPEWVEKMRERKREAEAREREDFDTPVPDADDRDTPQKTAAMDPDEVGSLTEGLDEAGSEPASDAESRDGDTTEIERDATKAINRGELDTLMKEKEQEERAGQQDSDATSERTAPKASVISKTSRTKTERTTREVEDEAAQAVEDADSKPSGLSIPRPEKKPRPSDDAQESEESLDEDSFGDFTDEDLHAVVFGEDEDDAANESSPASKSKPSLPKPNTSAAKNAQSSPSLDFSDIASEAEKAEPPPAQADEQGPTGDDDEGDEPMIEAEAPAPPDDDEAAMQADELPESQTGEADDLPTPDAVPDEPLVADPGPEQPSEDPPQPLEDDGQPDTAAARAQPAAPAETDRDAPDVEPPGDFPQYDETPGRPLVASVLGFIAALLWVVGGAMGMFTSLPSPWESTVPAMTLGAGIVAFLLVLVGPPRKIESAILAVLGIGIGGFAFVQWSNLGTFAVTDYLGMAPLVGAGLAIIAAIATLMRPSGSVEEF